MTNKVNESSLVVIFGRTNVGKSTMFNRLIEQRQALVADSEGTTRDSNVGSVDWRGRNIQLVDTGGIIDIKGMSDKTKINDTIAAKVQQQASQYIKRAELVLFVVDNSTGLLPQDKALVLALKKIFPPKKIILVVNKVDKLSDQVKISDFYKLGLGQPNAVSAANGSGTGDLLDVVFKKLSKSSTFNNESERHKSAIGNIIKVCIVGKPNVGKSSLLNSLLGYERVIVSPLPHTTREPQDTEIIYDQQPIKLVDTAGISRKARLKGGLIKKGIEKSIAALTKADLALLVLDISREISREDCRLADEIIKRKKSLIIIANKWDIIKDRQTKKYTDYIRAELPFIRFAPIQFISAKTGEKVQKILNSIIEIKSQRQIMLDQDSLQVFLNKIIRLHRPVKGKGVKHPTLKEFRQSAVNPPKFELSIGFKQDLHDSYIRFIENRLRENFGFLGTPITIKIVKKI